MRCDRIRALVDRAKASSDSGYPLALLLLVLRADDQDRINARSTARFLRCFGRDLAAYLRLGVALRSNLMQRRFEELLQNTPEICDVVFDPAQLEGIGRTMGTIASYLESLPVDDQNRVNLGVVQERINSLQAAIG